MRVKPLPDSHLSSAQLSEWVMGERSDEATQHVASCVNCQSKIRQFEGALGVFRGSVREWSEEQLPSFPRVAPARGKRSRVAALTAAYVMAALAMVVLLRHEGVWKIFDSQRIAAIEIHSPVSAKEDAELLTQIDQETSRTVPAAMDALSGLVAGDGARASASVKVQ